MEAKKGTKEANEANKSCKNTLGRLYNRGHFYVKKLI